jgi:ABC-type phosphate transport system substrate-binding protein
MIDKIVVRFGNSSTGRTVAILLFFLTSCTQATPTATPETIRVQYSFSAQPMLGKLNTCAGKNIVSTELRGAGFQDLQTADLVMRVGQPDNLTNTAYQIATDNLIVIVNHQNPLTELTIDQVRGIFTGRIQTWKSIKGMESQIQVWVFPTAEDVQKIFEESILGGSRVTSLARLANSPEEMSRSVSNDPNSIGLLTTRLKTANITVAYTAVSSLPVLAITQSNPHGFLAQIIACLQK